MREWFWECSSGASRSHFSHARDPVEDSIVRSASALLPARVRARSLAWDLFLFFSLPRSMRMSKKGSDRLCWTWNCLMEASFTWLVFRELSTHSRPSFLFVVRFQSPTIFYDRGSHGNDLFGWWGLLTRVSENTRDESPSAITDSLMKRRSGKPRCPHKAMANTISPA